MVGSHYEILGYDGSMLFFTIRALSPFEIYDGNAAWLASHQMFVTIVTYPGSNQWGRRWIPESINWNPSGNTGYKTIAEWNALQADITAGIKRNLVGTPRYS
ncbi:hypothetical protein [Leptospira kanakyensis]|uniref:Uncharacterized protein n=1 Tax=Leptospira kanakyensis TaxID=2484968 RepID=A0A6N4Q8W3_9LEPT|nr:hypothetical protein [Leptospira kanakyensis]TGK67097.1 hypothetical protein EHQ18_18540 [Leptospira kanakyensis]